MRLRRSGTKHLVRTCIERSSWKVLKNRPLNLCVTCSRQRGGPRVLGRSTVRDTDLYSTCCAIQNLWLAARAEGIGVGWVSILNHAALKRVLGIPRPVKVLAYLCLGYVSEFAKKPDLEAAGWRARLSVQDLVHYEAWGKRVEGKERLPGCESPRSIQERATRAKRG
jgi:5,6-dimethylbenzimidazole synthase